MATSTTPKTFVGYLRVSTAQQGQSGLGLDAQRHAVAEYVTRAGGVLVGEFVEIESGRNSSRPKLREALMQAKVTNSVLVVAKLDRLARNLRFLAELMDGDVPFVACDLPSANRLTLHLLASVAEAEAEFVSTRTREGLRMAKMRGTKLGRPENLTPAAQAKGRRTIAQQARERYRITAPLILAWRREGLSYERIAEQLTRLHVELSAGNGRWFPAQVRKVEQYAKRWAAEDAVA